MATNPTLFLFSQRLNRTWLLLATMCFGLYWCGPDAAAQQEEPGEYFYVVDRADLKLGFQESGIHTFRITVPYAVLEGGHAAWVCPKVNNGTLSDFDIAVRSTKPLPLIEGVLYHPDAKHKKLKETPFRFAPAKASTKEKFLTAVEQHYQYLLRNNFTGRIWFQHRLDEIRKELGKKKDNSDTRFRGFNNSLDRSFDMFSGARAIAENIQLDRNLANAGEGEMTVDVNSIEGITIKEFDWDTVLKPEAPVLDPLAKYIPHDQHVYFFNSVAGIDQALKEVSSFITPSLGFVSTQSIDRQVIPFYFRQMALDPGAFAKQKFFTNIRTVAITGSDPFSEIGTDVGVLFEMTDESAAKEFADYYLKQIRSLGPLSGIENSGGNQTPTRELSAYGFAKGKLFVISNSNYQITKLHSVIGGDGKNLAELKEYHFFRQRYRKVGDETAFAFMSDPAIRRWCSPRWRIGQSRRLRALSRLQMLQAKYMQTAMKMDGGKSQAAELSIADARRLGEFTVSASGVHSTRYNTMHFMTPIAELGIDKVSDQEKAAYDRWRSNYQRNWSQAFDPIGIQLKIQPKKVEVDLSVIPLIMNSSYRWLANGKAMDAFAGDLHPRTLIHVAAAPGMDRFLEPYLKGLEMTEVFADDDPTFWRDFTDEQEAEKYFRENVNKLPVAVVFNFDNAKNMQKALDSTKFFIATEIISETEHRHRGKMYKRLEFDKRIINSEENLKLYVYKHNSSAYFTLSEQLIHRAVERRLKTDRPKNIRPWLGENFSAQFDQKFFRAMEGMSADYYQQELRRLSWLNLAILNEWNREFPNRDSFELQEKYWGETLVCPGGGNYQWDDETGTYYSSAFGSPARPRIPMGTPFPLRQLKFIDAGFGFVTDGIRARLKMEKK